MTLGASDTKLGGAYIEIRARMDKLNTDMAEAKTRATGLGSIFSGANLAIVGAIGGITAAFQFAKDAIKEYASLEAATATTNVIFGDSAKLVTAEADRMAKAYGTVKSANLAAANSFGMTLKNMQFTKEQAADLSVGLNQLAGDLGAAWDKPFEQAALAIDAAFRGESLPIKGFGVDLSAAKLEMEAMRNGFTKLNGELTPAAKSFAAMSIILRDSKDSQGAMAREANQLGSQLRRASGNITNMAGELGGALAPAVQGFLGMLEDLGRRFSWVWTGALKIIGNFSASVGSAFSSIGPRISSFLDSFTDIGQRIQSFASVATGWIASMVDSLGMLSKETIGFGFSATGVWEGIGNAITWAQNTLKWAVDGGQMIFRNFGDVLEIVGLKFWEFGTNVVEVMSTVPENLGRVGNWIANNWRELISEGLNAVWAVFQNLSHNIGELAHEIWQFLSDPLSEWDPDFKPLLEGFKATVDQFPELLKPSLSLMDEEIAKVGQRINDREAAYTAEGKGGAPGMPATPPLKLDLQAAKAADAAMKKMMGGARGVEIIDGGTNMWRKIQESVSGQGAQQIQQQQLDQQKKIADAGVKTADALQQIVEGRGKLGGPSVAVLA